MCNVTSIQTSPDAQVKVCRNKSTGDFAIVHYCRYKWPFSATEVGNMDRVSAKEFEKKGLALVVKSLTSFPSHEKTERSEMEALTEAEQRKFDKGHEHVLVTINDAGGLLVQPFKGGAQDTYGTSDSLATCLCFPIDEKQFYCAVLEALKNAD